MADLNKVFLLGRLTQDPELRYTPNGAAVTDLRLATSRTFTTKDGDRREEPLYIDVTVWNRQAENCCQYLAKGRQVHVEGYLKMDSWDDKSTGEKRSKIKVEAERVQFLDSGRREDGAPGAPGAAGGRAEEDDFAPPPPRRDRESEGPPPRRAAAPAEPRSYSNGPGRAPAGPAPRRAPAPPPASDAEDEIPC